MDDLRVLISVERSDEFKGYRGIGAANTSCRETYKIVEVGLATDLEVTAHFLNHKLLGSNPRHVAPHVMRW